MPLRGRRVAIRIPAARPPAIVDNLLKTGRPAVDRFSTYGAARPPKHRRYKGLGGRTKTHLRFRRRSGDDLPKSEAATAAVRPHAFRSNPRISRTSPAGSPAAAIAPLIATRVAPLAST
jgi:hypothetical protein